MYINFIKLQPIFTRTYLNSFVAIFVSLKVINSRQKLVGEITSADKL